MHIKKLSLEETYKWWEWKIKYYIKNSAKLTDDNMLGPYNTSDSPITIAIVALIVIIVPLLSPYCY